MKQNIVFIRQGIMSFGKRQIIRLVGSVRYRFHIALISLPLYNPCIKSLNLKRFVSISSFPDEVRTSAEPNGSKPFINKNIVIARNGMPKDNI